jgi:hypothetical protein
MHDATGRDICKTRRGFAKTLVIFVGERGRQGVRIETLAGARRDCDMRELKQTLPTRPGGERRECVCAQ